MGQSSFGGALTVTQMYQWMHFGMTAGLTSDGCSRGDVFIGPNFRIGNLFISPAASVGLEQGRTNIEFKNSIIGDKLTIMRPAPNFKVGAALRIGYKIINRVSVHVGVGYSHLMRYGRSDYLSEPWVLVSEESETDVLSVEIGASYNLSSDELLSGDNCLVSGISAGASSMGAYVSADVKAFNRIGFNTGHSYGGFTTFYCENGGAEIGGVYELNLFPCGSDSWYTAAVGAEVAMGMYPRTFSGLAQENPDRFRTEWGIYSFGGGFRARFTPFGVQIGRFNLSAYASVGAVGVLPAKGEGNLQYQVTSNNWSFQWMAGGRVECAF
jgi:hypothetical protein